MEELASALPSNSVLIMDNLRVHAAEVTIESILTFFYPKNCAVGLLPVYSPDLNPIEIFFGIVKGLSSKVLHFFVPSTNMF